MHSKNVKHYISIAERLIKKKVSSAVPSDDLYNFTQFIAARTLNAHCTFCIVFFLTISSYLSDILSNCSPRITPSTLTTWAHRRVGERRLCRLDFGTHKKISSADILRTVSRKVGQSHWYAHQRNLETSFFSLKFWRYWLNGDIFFSNFWIFSIGFHQ